MKAAPTSLNTIRELALKSYFDSNSSSIDDTLSRTPSPIQSQTHKPHLSISMCMKTQFPNLIRSFRVSEGPFLLHQVLVSYFD